MTIRLTEAELARDLHAVLEKVSQGMEVLVEQENSPIAMLKAPQVIGRNINDVISALESMGGGALVDEDFAHDVQEGIKAHRQKWNPSSGE